MALKNETSNVEPKSTITLVILLITEEGDQESVDEESSCSTPFMMNHDKGGGNCYSLT